MITSGPRTRTGTAPRRCCVFISWQAGSRRDELDDRLGAALSAVTFGDLRRALADLPGPDRRCPMTAGWSAVTGACWLCTRPGTGACMRKRCWRC